MARWKTSLPQQYMKQLVLDHAQMQADVAMGAVPVYSQFVKNLLKDGNTASEEFLHASVGLSGESGETLDLAKKVYFYGKELPVEKLLEEMGDFRFYYQALLNHFGLTDEHVIAQNVKKLRVRYASGKFSEAQANARADKPEERKFMRDDRPGVGPVFRALDEGPLEPPLGGMTGSQVVDAADVVVPPSEPVEIVEAPPPPPEPRNAQGQTCEETCGTMGKKGFHSLLCHTRAAEFARLCEQERLKPFTGKEPKNADSP
jgi:NTP pyrophosphatase (non-canonical NTP hydrolase)